MVNIKDLELKIPEEKEVRGIKVKQYIPIEEKMNVIGNIVNNSVDENSYYNPTRLNIYYVLNILNAYTDIDMGTETILSVYDKVMCDNLWYDIKDNIPENELNMINNCVNKIIENIYAYKNSAVGVLEAISNQYNETKEDGKQLQKDIANPENLKLLKDIMDKLG